MAWADDSHVECGAPQINRRVRFAQPPAKAANGRPQHCQRGLVRRMKQQFRVRDGSHYEMHSVQEANEAAGGNVSGFQAQRSLLVGYQNGLRREPRPLRGYQSQRDGPKQHRCAGFEHARRQRVTDPASGAEWAAPRVHCCRQFQRRRGARCLSVRGGMRKM